MRVLLDTCVLSELRRPKGHPGVRQAVAALDSEDLFVSVITIGEIAKGISLLREGPHKRTLQSWLQTLERYYADRLLPIDLETSRIWENLQPKPRNEGGWFTPATVSSLPRHGATVCT